MVGHDEDHRGLFFAQRHVQDVEIVLFVLIEVIETWKETSDVLSDARIQLERHNKITSRDGNAHLCDAS